MKTAIFLLAPAGAGKTTMLNYIGNKYSSTNVSVVSIGQQCRAKFGVDAFVADKNPVTPAISESFVRDLVKSKLDKEYSYDHQPSVTVFDGFPRSVEQVEYLASLNTDGVMKQFVWLNCSLPDVVRRLTLRNGGQKIDDLSYARLGVETKQFADVLIAIGRRGYDITSIDTSDCEDKMRPLHRISHLIDWSMAISPKSSK
jgi:adenylate kinase family enzyme